MAVIDLSDDVAVKCSIDVFDSIGQERFYEKCEFREDLCYLVGIFRPDS
jgi:hypothetical protein